jgi:translation initiation factor IF-2
LHQVIYNAIDEIESAMKGMLEPTYKEEITGQAEIREIYKVSKVGTIGGGMVTDGVIHRDSGVRVIRDGVVIYDGKLASLRRFKDDVKEVKQGFELGLRIEDYNDIKVNDVIEAYVMKEVPVE